MKRKILRFPLSGSAHGESHRGQNPFPLAIVHFSHRDHIEGRIALRPHRRSHRADIPRPDWIKFNKAAS
jgi:hypothetical protein